MSVVNTSFKNDENARPPTLLKKRPPVTNTDILIDTGERTQVKGCYCFTKSLFI